jgi:hypothetical protein
MRVHRASGNDIPLAVLNNQSLNQVFVGGNQFISYTSTGSTASTVTLNNDIYEIEILNTIQEISRINSNSFTTSDKVYVRFDMKSPNLGILQQRWGASGTGIKTHNFNIINAFIPFSHLANPSLDNNQIRHRGSYTNQIWEVGKFYYIKDIYVIFTNQLGIDNLTQSQLDYLFTVWQFNTLNALVARQFIQEA